MTNDMIGKPSDHRHGRTGMIAVALGAVLMMGGCEAINDPAYSGGGDLPPAPHAAQLPAGSGQGAERETPDAAPARTAPGSEAQAAPPPPAAGAEADGDIPPAPYETMPGYESPYPDYWQQTQRSGERRDTLARADDLDAGPDARPSPAAPPANMDDSTALPTRPEPAAQRPDGDAPPEPSPQADRVTGQAAPSQPTGGPDESDDRWTRDEEWTPPPRVEDAAAGAAPEIIEGNAYGLHLASYRREDNARRGWDVLAAAYPDLLAGLTPSIATADLPGLGLYYRLKAGPIGDRGEAMSLCRQIESRGDYCAVMAFDGEEF